MRIYKYKLEVTDFQQLVIKKNAEFMTLQVQGGKPVLWAAVDPDEEDVVIEIQTYGTGVDMLEDWHKGIYLGTYQLDLQYATFGTFVGHVFTRSRPN